MQGSSDSSKSGGYSSRYRRSMLYANVHSFASRTSAHGLGRFFSQQIPWLRLLWIAVVVGALTGLTMHTYKQVSLFSDYPVSSTTRLLTNRFTFPDVTFCDPLMKKFLVRESSDLRNSNRSISNYFGLSYVVAHKLVQSSKGPEQSDIKAIRIAYSSFEHAVHTWPEFNMTDMSARIIDMLVYCQYNQEPCNEQNFTVFYHRDYGNCFSFKATNRLMKSSGVEKGLVLVLYSPSVDIIQNNDLYSNIVTTGLETGGLRVVVHQKDTIPYPSEYGINSPSGMQTVLALNQVQTSLANTPTKRCEPRAQFDVYDHLLNKSQGYEKQLADCTTFEHLRSVQQKCKCTIEGLVETPTYGSGEKRINFCHDIMGSQHPNELMPMLDKIEAFLLKNQLAIDNKLFVNGKFNMPLFGRMPIEKRLQLSQELVAQFPSLVRRLERLNCAMPLLKTGRRQSNCLNICKYTTYDFSVFQSRWPDINLAIRGARIRLTRIASMLSERINYVNKLLNGKDNNAMNHSIVTHKVNLSECVGSALDKKNNTFSNDTHCQKVHNIIRQSFLQLRVYPKTLTVRQLYEERSYELVNLFSDLGGIMGLWIGVSMVTLCEFAEIILIMVSYYTTAAMRRVREGLQGLRGGAGSGHQRSRSAAEPEWRQPAADAKRLYSGSKPGTVASGGGHRRFDHTCNVHVYRQPRRMGGGTGGSSSAPLLLLERQGEAPAAGNNGLPGGAYSTRGKETRL